MSGILDIKSLGSEQGGAYLDTPMWTSQLVLLNPSYHKR